MNPLHLDCTKGKTGSAVRENFYFSREKLAKILEQDSRLQVCIFISDLDYLDQNIKQVIYKKYAEWIQAAPL